MGLRGEFQKRIEKKQQEIRDLELKLKEANSYLQALLDSLKLLPRDSNATNVEQVLRPGTTLAKARDAIKKAGKPLHVSEILKILDKPIDKKNRVSLGGSLSGYVRRGEIFTRPAPNTFGLRELEESESEPAPPDDELPPSFGKV
jgi:septal ring factor EnvC (AmiA/AmiB activator)